MDTPDDSRTTVRNITTTDISSGKTNIQAYLTLSIVLGCSLLIAVVVVVAILVVRFMKRIQREDAEESMPERTNERQSTEPPRRSSDRDALFVNTSRNHAGDYTENLNHGLDYQNANTVENYTGTAPTTPPPVHPSLGCSTRAMNPTSKAEYKEKFPCLSQNASYGSVPSSNSSSPEPMYENTGTYRNLFYDHCQNTAVPMNSVRQDNALYDHPSNIVVPVCGATQDDAHYDRPSNIAVSVGSDASEEYIYDRPRKTIVPAEYVKHDESIYQRPQHTPVPVKWATGGKSTHNPPHHKKVPADETTDDAHIYDRPPLYPVPIKSATRNDYPVQSPTNTQVREASAICRPKYSQSPATEDDPEYDRPSAFAVGMKYNVNNSSLHEGTGHRIQTPRVKAFFPVPSPRPSKDRELENHHK